MGSHSLGHHRSSSGAERRPERRPAGFGRRAPARRQANTDVDIDTCRMFRPPERLIKILNHRERRSSGDGWLSLTGELGSRRAFHSAPSSPVWRARGGQLEANAPPPSRAASNGLSAASGELGDHYGSPLGGCVEPRLDGEALSAARLRRLQAEGLAEGSHRSERPARRWAAACAAAAEQTVQANSIYAAHGINRLSAALRRRLLHGRRRAAAAASPARRPSAVCCRKRPPLRCRRFPPLRATLARALCCCCCCRFATSNQIRK